MKRFLRSLSIGQSVLLSIIALVGSGILLVSFVQYLLYMTGTDAIIDRQSREINKQIVLNYEAYVSSVIETMNNFDALTRELDVDASAEAVRSVWRLAMDSKRDIVSVSLYSSDAGLVLSTSPSAAEGALAPSRSGFGAATDVRDIFVFDTLSRPESASVTGPAVAVLKAVEYGRGGERFRGVLSVALNLRTLTDLADKTDLGKEGYILILDEAGALVFTTLGPASARARGAVGLADRIHFGGLRDRSGSLVTYVNVNTVSQTRWRIVTGYDISDVSSIRVRTVLVTLAVVTLVLLAAAFAASLVSLRISRPLARLEHEMGEVENGRFDIRVEERGQREIAALAHAFNRMIEEIRTLMGRVVAEQREKRKTELRALQNQINPHFLYNTLDSIVWLAENDRTRDVITTVVALARFFRIGISRGDQFIPVADELEHIRNYLTIQKIRYMDRFAYRIDVEDAVLGRKVMKLILQPIVENAINHGIGDETAGITIRGYADPDLGRTVFEVRNTGYGLTRERIGEIMESLSSSDRRTGVGLRNTWQRLKVYYGEGAGIEIESVPDESTTVRVWIPEEGTDERSES